MKVNRKIYNVFLAIWSFLLLTIVYWNSTGKIHFGWGIADVLISALGLISIIAVVLFSMFARRKYPSNKIQRCENFFVLYALILLVFFILKMTIWRGELSPWDGNIFF